MTDISMQAPISPQGNTRRDIEVMALIGFAHACSHFFQLVLPPLFPFLREAFQVSYTQLGLVMTVFSATSGLLQTPAGFLVDRIGARNVLIGGLAIFCVAVLLYGLVPNYWLLLPVAMLAGAGNSVFHPADYSILSASVNQNRIGRAYGSHTLGGNLGWAVAPAFMGAAAWALGWRGALALAAAVGLLALLALVLRRDSLKEDIAVRKEQAESGVPAKLPLFTLPIVMCFVYFLMLATALIGIQNFFPVIVNVMYGTPLTIATMALTGFLLGASAGVVIGSILADRKVPPYKLVTFGLLAASTLIFIVAFVDLPNALLVALVTLAGFLQGSTTPSRDMIVRQASPKGASGRVFGFVYSGLDAGSALAPLAIGILLDHGNPQAVLLMVAVILALTTLTVLGIGKTSRQA
ncbi:MFS transporter [Ferrovibrio sp.]|uniref:MFS transporter n=1 Tax=Ferrovibrio sp. TaxID=1917215 RepID=UPI0025C1CA7E|nr:MFS transporter [Ferrovibrio sp.]MBX3454750.1 MFS transporter [Ferrovibrio sp.]